MGAMCLKTQTSRYVAGHDPANFRRVFRVWLVIWLTGLSSSYGAGEEPSKPGFWRSLKEKAEHVPIPDSQRNAATGKLAPNRYSITDDITIGKLAMAENNAAMRESGIQINADPARVKQLEKIVARIAPVTHRPTLPYNVVIYHAKINNAATFPGGAMFVFEGLYDKKTGLARTTDELAFVIAHEMAHAVCRHSTQEMTVDAGLESVKNFAVQAARKKENEELATVLNASFSIGKAFLLPRHSRRNEFEADLLALKYMAQAGYNPQAAIDMWRRKIPEGSNDNDSTVIDGAIGFLSTHPATEDRLQALQKALPEIINLYRK